MTPREERKARNVYNESLRRAQSGDTSSYVRGEMSKYGISDPSVASFRDSPTPQWQQNLGQKTRNFIPGIWGAGMQGLEALTEGVAMANENARWFKQNAPDTKRHAGVPMNVRESVMTGRDTDFYDKYMKLAKMTQDADKRQYYLDQADTARRNLQVTKRINYGMGQMDLDPTPFEGYKSYDQGFGGFGPNDMGPRFDIDRFSEAMSEYLPGGEEITEDLTETIAETPLGTIEEDDIDDRILRGPFPPGIAYPGYNEPVTLMGDLPPIEPETNEIFNEEVFNKVYELIHPTGQTAAEMPEHFDLYKTPWNMFQMMKESMEEGEWNDQELLDLLVERGYLKDTTGGEDLDPSKYPSQLRFEDKVKSMSLEEMEKLLEDQETWEGDRIDI